MGVPLSTLHGRPRRFRADFVYDDDGRLVGLTGELESPWTDVDTDVVRAVAEDRAARCDGCGHPTDQTFDPELERHWTAHPRQCHSCAAGERAFKHIDDRAGVKVFTTLDD